MISTTWPPTRTSWMRSPVLGARHRLRRMGHAELRIALAHFAEDCAIALGKTDRNTADLEIEQDIVFLRTPAAQHKRRPQRGVAGERQLFFRSEDADLNSPLL